MGKTSIEWADVVWNPVTGCTKVSQGCKFCFAESIANRFWGERKFTDVQMHPERLEYPNHWTKPRRVFVNSMSDLFHEKVTDSFIANVFAVMALNPRHTFMVLTKRPDRMMEFVKRFPTSNGPIANIWLGVSVENQQAADERIPLLLQTPAVVRFISAEPLLGPVDLDMVFRVPDGGAYHYNTLTGENWPFTTEAVYGPHLDWIICGGESGPHARPMRPNWARSLRDQCQKAGVPFFFKQWGEWGSLEDHPGTGYLVGDKRTGFFEDQWPKDSRFCVGGVSSHGQHMVCVGKKSAGRKLDGVEWLQFPEESNHG